MVEVGERIEEGRGVDKRCVGWERWMGWGRGERGERIEEGRERCVG